MENSSSFLSQSNYCVKDEQECVINIIHFVPDTVMTILFS